MRNILGIVSQSEDLVVKYLYSAYGNNMLVSGTLANTIGVYNPFRYKGYYYDKESNMYYCKSRYYVPDWCRWLNCDNPFFLDTESLTGMNLFAYCGNNPVMMIDDFGCKPKWWQTILMGVGIIAGAALVATEIAFTGGGAGAFFLMAGKAALGRLKIAAAVGATAGVIRVGNTALAGGLLNDVGKSLITGFADGFFAGAVYAGTSMILSAGAFRILGNYNGGRGWNKGKWEFGYQTPNTPGTSATYHGGKNGGRSFGIDIDIFNGVHFHTKLFGIGKKSEWIKNHHWYAVPLFIGIGVGFSDPWSEW